MRRTGRVAQLNLLLTCAALLLLLAAVAWLVPPLAGPVAAQPPAPDEPSPGGDDPLLDGAPAPETITPTTILEMFFTSGAAESSAESGAGGQADLEGLSSDGALYFQDPVLWNPGGTQSMDWGDVDRDGDLDLIAASVDSVAVYANEKGKLKLKWREARSGLGVRWFDLDLGNEPKLEAVVVGEGDDGPPAMTIYLEPESSSSSVRYNVPAQLLRVEAGEFDVNDDVDHIDLVASTNALDPPSGCPVVLFRRRGGDPPYGDTLDPECVSDEATASLAAADADRDGDLDLALGLHSSKEIRVVLNYSGTLSTTLLPNPTLLVDDHLAHIPYDLAWGDYNGDGWLDLAAAFPLEQEVRIYDNDYENNHGAPFARSHTLTTDSFLTPLAVDWADLDGDGRLELIVGDLPPKIYEYNGTTFTAVDELPIQTGRIQEIRAIDADNDVDLDVAVANQYASSALFANAAPLLGPSLTSLPGGGAGSVAWGDVDTDGYLDLLDGGSLYPYDDSSGDFGASTQISATAEIGAFGDVDGDGYLDIALGNPTGCEVRLRPKSSGAYTVPLSSCSDPRGFAWADYDDDGILDLAAALPSGIKVYRGNEAVDSFPVLFSYDLTGGARDVAWADYDGDHWLDLAVAHGTRVRLYHHELDGSLTAGPVLADGCDARSLAWGDWDGNGDEDLAVGCYGGRNLIYENAGNGPWEGPDPVGGTSQTTSLAWGDWDNDGDLDLAVGNEGQKDQVYVNTGGALALDPASGVGWESNVLSATTSLAWGDKDGDGDLDLAVTGSDGSGWYANNYVLPAHLGDAYGLLPRNPSYLSVARPGTAPDAYFYSSPETLAGPETSGTMSVTYTLYDPEDNPVSGLFYEYSLDGGGYWLPAMHVSGADLTAKADGITHTLAWDAQEDEAVGDNARFRITIVHGKPAGPVQRASTSAVSPPFRVRATTCIWPSGPSITITPSPAEVGEKVTFNGSVAGSGLLTFRWDLGDGATAVGPQVSHYYDKAGTYTVKLTVTGEACPVARSVMVTETLVIEPSTSSTGVESGEPRLYLPLILRRGAAERP